MAKLSRRKFIVRSLAGGTGILLGATYLGRHALRREVFESLDTAAMLSYNGNVSEPMLWFEVTEDNQVVFYCPKVEMGQGTLTGLAQIAAEELEIGMNQLRAIQAPTDSQNIDQVGTGGSTSIAGLWQPLRELAATLREMLKIEASRKLNVDVASLSITDGVIAANDQSITYGEVVQGVTDWEIPETPPLKPAGEFRHVGKPLPRIDLEDKVMGAPIFGMDAEMPDMLFGAVVRPAKIGATYQGADISAARSMPGVVKIVEENDFVGVVAQTRTQAERAKQAIRVRWKTARNWQSKDIEDITTVGNGDNYVVQRSGSPAQMLGDAESGKDSGYLTAEYRSPIGAHAQLEPNGAVAYVEKDKATVMISTQVLKITRTEVAARLGMDEEQVNVIPTYLGGGFGRRLHTPNAIQAAVLSKAVGYPVKCFFDRKEEFQNDNFRPPTHHVMRGKLDEQGNIQALEHSYASGDVMYGSPMIPGFLEPLLGADGGANRGAAIMYKGIPDFQVVAWRTRLPFATSWWRSLGLLANTFAIESFMDELAEKSGQDPVAFRLKHLAQSDERGQRLAEVIKTAAEKSGYRNAPEGNRAMGFAASIDANTPVAQVAEVSVTNNQIKVHKVTCVIDVGMAINPDQIRAQCEGCVIMGISAAMYEKMEVADGELQPIIYGPYKMALMRDAPEEIDVFILENSNKPGAVGEPPLGPVGAAIANAAYRVTGKRLRTMPLQQT